MRGRDDEREIEIDRQAADSGEFVNPIAFLRALEQAAGDNALLVADGGDFVATASYVLHPRGPLSWLDPGAFGTLGVGAGFALGAALARPDREVWIVYGDGACGYGLAEFDTFVRHGIPVIAVVGNDAGWTQIAREQVEMLHDDVATVLARTDYHKVAEGFGAEGIVVKKMSEVPAALAQAREFAQAGQAGAGERVARQDGVPRGVAVDVTGAAAATCAFITVPSAVGRPMCIVVCPNVNMTVQRPSVGARRISWPEIVYDLPETPSQSRSNERLRTLWFAEN